MARNEPECASRVHGELSSFCGEFISTWQEDDGPADARLVISTKAANPNKCGIYSLEWFKHPKEGADQLSFEGEAMLSDSLLLGDYQAAT